MSSANMTAATRELWIPGVTKQVMYGMPLFAKLADRRRMPVKGGLSIKKTLDYAEVDDLAQEYAGSNTPLESGKKDFLTTAYFNWKKFQVPIEYDEDEESENRGGIDTAPVDLVREKVDKGTRAAKIKLQKMIYGAYSATSDSDTGFQGIGDALHSSSTTYGNLARSTTSNTWWMGASLDESWTDIATACSASIATFRDCHAKISLYADGPQDILVLCGSNIFQSLQGQVEASGANTNLGKTSLGKYGFTAIEIDGIEVVYDPFLDIDPDSNTTSTWFIMLNVATWECRWFPGRDLRTVTPFEYQGKVVNGYDKYLARVLAKGNLVCWKPNANILKTNMS